MHVRHSSNVIVSLFEVGKSDTLAGSACGAATLAGLIAKVHRVLAPTLVFLDFVGVAVATASFLRESVFGFRDYCRRSQPNLYPVIANASDSVSEELLFLLRDRREAFPTCRMTPKGTIADPRLIGTLEQKQELTFKAVTELKEADASILAARFADSERIGMTGWNNRLASLVAGGILMEVRSGRNKRYRPVLEGLGYGS
jgi:hypothetical protein